MRVLYLYPSLVAGELQKVAAGEAPSDRLYGLLELRRLGHQVDIADSRFEGRFGRVVKRLRQHSLNICDVTTLRRLRHYDVVIVKDEFSPLITTAAHLAGAKVVYLDALMQLPRSSIKRTFMRSNLRQADAVVAYASTQIDLWTRTLAVPPGRIRFLPYTIDTAFYAPVDPPAAPPRPYVLSVGRDPGRDFAPLLAALEGTGLDLKLVTVPYLLKGLPVDRPGVEVLQRLPYDELFRLYAGATLVAIPLKTGLTYPSGIRGLLETLALGRPAVATRTPVLEEYARDGEGVAYVEPGQVDALRQTILTLAGDGEARRRLAAPGRELVRARYSMDVFARGLDTLLAELRA
jgi:glycosyltransferase involved in cell wall biosynthesis